MPTNSPLFPPITSAFNARSTALEVVKGISLDSKNAVVTGGASGLGLETSRALVSAGANVTLAVRNLYQGKAPVSELQSTYPNASVQVMHLDLADLATPHTLQTPNWRLNCGMYLRRCLKRIKFI